MGVCRGIFDFQCLATLPRILDVACSNPSTWDLQYWTGLFFIFPRFLKANIDTGLQQRPWPFPCTYSVIHYARITLLYSYTNTASLDETSMCFCKSQLTQIFYYLSPDVREIFTPTSTQNIAYLIFTNCLMCKVTYHRTYVRTYVVWNVWCLVSGRFGRTEARCLHCIKRSS